MSVKVISPPSVEPISVEEAKSFLHGIDYDDQDENIARFITAARQRLERRCGRCIAEQELELRICGFGDVVMLERPPVVDVLGVKYIDRDGEEQEIDSANFTLIDDEYLPYLYPLTEWPTDAFDRPDAVRIKYLAGHEPDDVPEDLKQAMRLLIGSMFENRENELLVPTRQELMILGDGVEVLIAPYIVPRL